MIQVMSWLGIVLFAALPTIIDAAACPCGFYFSVNKTTKIVHGRETL